MCQSQNHYFWYIHQNFLNVSVPFCDINNEDNLLSREFKSILNSELALKSKNILETLQHVLTEKMGGLRYFLKIKLHITCRFRYKSHQ